MKRILFSIIYLLILLSILMTPANSENSILLRLDALKKSMQMYTIIDSELKKTITNIDSNHKAEIERIAVLYQVYSEYLNTEINQSPTDESYTNKLNLIINNFNKKLQILQQESHDIDEVNNVYEGSKVDKKETIYTALSNRLKFATQKLPDGVVGIYYMTSIEVNGGKSPYHWRISPELPGIDLNFENNSCIISGLIERAGKYQILVIVRDNNNNSVERRFNLFAYNKISFTNSDLLKGMVNEYYLDKIKVEGGKPPYKYSLSHGSLPIGLSMEQDKLLFIKGVPAKSGLFRFTIFVADSIDCMLEKNFSIDIGE